VLLDDKLKQLVTVASSTSRSVLREIGLQFHELNFWRLYRLTHAGDTTAKALDQISTGGPKTGRARRWSNRESEVGL
jgi:hypothetical protein